MILTKAIQSFANSARGLCECLNGCLFAGVPCHLQCWCLQWLSIQGPNRVSQSLQLCLSLLFLFFFLFSSSIPGPSFSAMHSFLLRRLCPKCGSRFLSIVFLFFLQFDSLTEKYVWTVSNCILTCVCILILPCLSSCQRCLLFCSKIIWKQMGANQRVPHHSVVTKTEHAHTQTHTHTRI